MLSSAIVTIICYCGITVIIVLSDLNATPNNAKWWGITEGSLYIPQMWSGVVTLRIFFKFLIFGLILIVFLGRILLCSIRLCCMFHSMNDQNYYIGIPKDLMLLLRSIISFFIYGLLVLLLFIYKVLSLSLYVCYY